MFHHEQLVNLKSYDVRIWQCTDFAQHWHSKTEIYVCLQGQVKICIEGKMYCLNQDDVVFVFGNEAHEIFCNVPNTKVALIAFGYELLGNDYRNIQNLSMDIPFFNLKDMGISLQILHPILQIIDVLCQPKEDEVTSDWKVRSSIYAIGAYIALQRSSKPISAERLLRAKYLEKMYGTFLYLCEHFREPITLEQAASASGYERSYFCKQFRRTTGMTFHKYLNYYRVLEACRLLSDTKISLSSIAEQSGFASQKNLSRLFRDVMGMTPTQYRKLPRETKNSLMTLGNILHL